MVSLKAWLSLGEKDGEVLLGSSARGVPSPTCQGQEPTGSQKLNKWISMGQKKGHRALWTRHLSLDWGSQLVRMVSDNANLSISSVSETSSRILVSIGIPFLPGKHGSQGRG